MNQSVVGFWLAVLVKNKNSLRKLYVYVYVYIYIYVNARTRSHTLTHAYTDMHPHTHTHTHTHTHRHTYIEGLVLKMKHRLQHPKTGVKGDDGFCGLGFGRGVRKRVTWQPFWQPTIFQPMATFHAHLGSVHCNAAGFTTLL